MSLRSFGNFKILTVLTTSVVPLLASKALRGSPITDEMSIANQVFVYYYAIMALSKISLPSISVNVLNVRTMSNTKQISTNMSNRC